MGTNDLTPPSTGTAGSDADRRLHDIGWGLLLVLTGAVFLVPATRVPEGAWLLGVAAILLGLNAVRFARHIAVSGLSTTLGLLALAAGAGRVAGVELPLLAICLVVIGLTLVFKPLVARPAH